MTEKTVEGGGDWSKGKGLEELVTEEMRQGRHRPHAQA